MHARRVCFVDLRVSGGQRDNARNAQRAPERCVWLCRITHLDNLIQNKMNHHHHHHHHIAVFEVCAAVRLRGLAVVAARRMPINVLRNVRLGSDRN